MIDILEPTPKLLEWTVLAAAGDLFFTRGREIVVWCKPAVLRPAVGRTPKERVANLDSFPPEAECGQTAIVLKIWV